MLFLQNIYVVYYIWTYKYILNFIYKINCILSLYVHIGVYIVCGYIVVVQLFSYVRFFVTPWTVTRQAFLSWVCSNLCPLSWWYHPTISPSVVPLLPLLSIFPSIRVFSSESALHIRWPEYWSLSFSISPFNEYPGLISFRIDWFDFFAVQGTLESLLQHHSSKVSIWCSAFFMVQLSHLHTTTGEP